MTTQSGRASVGEIELAYDLFGDRGMPLVLIMGIGAQRVFWDDALCELFVDAGFHVVRFDHRDIGESSRVDAPVPDPRKALLRRMVGAPVQAPYTLSHMAGDVAGLVEQLGFGSAHVVGVSLGGMVAQHLAIERPERVRSLTSIMSTPGGRRYLPKPSALRALFAPAPKTAIEAGLHAERVFTVLGSTAWPIDAERLREIGALAYTRGMSPRGFLRHFAAVLASGDRKAKLRDVKAPTLVIHGSCDPMFPLRAGRDLANLVPDATWLPIAGMGHDLPRPLWPTLVAAIKRHAQRAESAKVE
ncbi:MAG: alpha/beta fold hydrolase [Deltaproteobacteria bacterium]|nr:alpha/beta fold hydrolase [Deltaproteobacteria bacterium]